MEIDPLFLSEIVEGKRDLPILSWDFVEQELMSINLERIESKKLIIEDYDKRIKDRIITVCNRIENLTDRDVIIKQIEILISWLEKMIQKLQFYATERKNVMSNYNKLNKFQQKIFNIEFNFVNNNILFCEKKKNSCLKLMLFVIENTEENFKLSDS